jgi:Protein of unknown function (DUF1403)
MQTYRTFLNDDKRGGNYATTGDKPPPRIHHAPVIRADPDLISESVVDPGEDIGAPLPKTTKAKPPRAKAPETQAFPSPAPVPAWARASGRAGEGDPVFAAGAALALLDAFLRREPPCAGALRSRLALNSAAVAAKILRLNADEGALRDLRFAVGDELGPAAKLLRLWRDLATRPPSLDAGRLAAAAARLDLALPDPNGLASSLKACAGEGDPVSAAGKGAALVFSAFPDAPAAEAETFALWAFDLALATRLRWPRPLPLVATKVLDPSLRSDGGGRARPGEPAWENHAAAAIARAAAAALDLAAALDRRADTLLAVAPKLRAKPAQKIVGLLLAEDCVSPAEAARHAPMTDRAARRLFDRLVALGAAREVSGRPAFRLYGL